MVSPSTEIAPASRNAREHASSVAPVAITSSSSKIRKLSTRRPSRMPKAPRYRFPALVAPKRMLFRPRPGTHEQDRAIGELEASGECVAEHVHLVETPLAPALPAKRHGHDDVGGEILRFAPNQFGEWVAKPGAQRLNLYPFAKVVAARVLKREPVRLAIPANGKTVGVRQDADRKDGSPRGTAPWRARRRDFPGNGAANGERKEQASWSPGGLRRSQHACVRSLEGNIYPAGR